MASGEGSPGALRRLDADAGRQPNLGGWGEGQTDGRGKSFSNVRRNKIISRLPSFYTGSPIKTKSETGGVASGEPGAAVTSLLFYSFGPYLRICLLIFILFLEREKPPRARGTWVSRLPHVPRPRSNPPPFGGRDGAQPTGHPAEGL